MFLGGGSDIRVGLSCGLAGVFSGVRVWCNFTYLR